MLRVLVLRIVKVVLEVYVEIFLCSLVRLCVPEHSMAYPSRELSTTRLCLGFDVLF